MSYSAFLDDLNDFYKNRNELGLVDKVSLEVAQNAVRDDWLIAGRYKDLISFILENWDSGNCDDFMRPLLDLLIEKNEVYLFKRLWKGVLRHRYEKAWQYFSVAKKHFPTFEAKDLSKIDISNFNQFSTKEDIRRCSAFYRQYTLNGIAEFIDGLEILDQTEEIGKANELYQRVYSVQRPI